MIHMTIGLQASGKSNFVERTAPDGALIIAPDRIRKEVFGVTFDPNVEDGVWSHFFRMLEEGLKQKKEIYIDNTNVTRAGRARIIQYAKAYNVPVIGYWFHVPLEVCLHRNQARERVVPEYMIHHFAKMFEEPSMEEGFQEIKHIYEKDQINTETAVGKKNTKKGKSKMKAQAAKASSKKKN